jgi:hypothetical protein
MSILHAQLLARDLGACNTVLDLLERNVPCDIWAAVLGFDVDAERTESAVIGRTKLVQGNILGRVLQISRNLLWGLDSRVERIDNSHEGDLLYAVGILANSLSNLLVNLGFVLFRSKLDQEVSSVHAEHAWQQFVVIDIEAVHAVTVSARAGVNADVLTLLGGKTVKQSAERLGFANGTNGCGPPNSYLRASLVVQFNEGVQELGTSPWVARIILRCEAPFCEVDTRHLM